MAHEILQDSTCSTDINIYIYITFYTYTIFNKISWVVFWKYMKIHDVYILYMYKCDICRTLYNIYIYIYICVCMDMCEFCFLTKERPRFFHFSRGVSLLRFGGIVQRVVQVMIDALNHFLGFPSNAKNGDVMWLRIMVPNMFMFKGKSTNYTVDNFEPYPFSTQWWCGTEGDRFSHGDLKRNW